jgi:hypothetical protein
VIVPELENGSDAAVEVLPTRSLDGRVVYVVAIKQRYVLEPGGTPAPVGGAEVRLVDVPWEPEAPETSSIRYPTDGALFKPGTDVVAVGDAVAPGATPVTSLDVSVRVGALACALRVFGARTWYRGAVDLALTPPEPFERVALRWELAYGGRDLSDPAKPVEEARNPVGRGCVRHARTLIGQPAPQIEDPRALIRSQRTRPPPAGVAALAPSWSPRRERVGTMDTRWRAERMPLLPVDFDLRHFQAAVPALVSVEHLRGGEPVEVVGMRPDGPWRLAVPRAAWHVEGRFDRGGGEVVRPVLDTVVLEPGAGTLDLTWRAQLGRPLDGARVRAVRVLEKEWV